MILDADQLIFRLGVMERPRTERSIDEAISEFDRPGLCVFIDLERQVVLTEDLCPNSKVCVTTPELLRECGIDPDVEATHEFDNPYHHTLWLPEEGSGILVEKLWRAFRGPIPRGEISHEWRSVDLRGLLPPGP